MLFPLSGVVALFGVSVEEDTRQNTLRLESDPASISHARSPIPDFTLANFSYDYGLTTNGLQSTQFVHLRSKGLTQGFQADSLLQLTRLPGSPNFSISRGSLKLISSGGPAITIGDQNPYVGLDAFSAPTRGIGLDLGPGRWNALIYGGRPAVATLTALTGSVAQFEGKTFGVGFRRPWRSSEFSVGSQYFDGPERSGSALGAAYSRSSAIHQMKGQLLAGSFAGTSQGRSLGLALAEAFTPVQAISINGQFEHYGKAFLSPREDLRFTGQRSRAVSAIVRPGSFITFTSGLSERSSLRGDSRSEHVYHYGANASLPLGQPVQVSFFRSSQIDKNESGPASVALYSAATTGAHGFSAHMHYSEIELNHVPNRTLNITVSRDHKRSGRITFHDQLQLQMAHRWGFDWDMPFSNHFARIGIDRFTSSQNDAAWIPQAALKVGLPGGYNIQLSYLGERNASTLQFQIGGSFSREAGSRGMTSGGAVILAELSGQIYFDSDNDGKFTPGNDRTLPDVSVWLDNMNHAVSDAHGAYRFRDVTPGAHAVKADLSGVPAEMVFSDASERTIGVLPQRTNTLNFRVVRTGQVMGKVTYVDYVTDPDKPTERPLPDVHLLIATAEYDTFSEVNGHFIIGDLPPGTYEVTVDPSTVPAGYVAQPATRIVTVEPGELLREVSFVLAIPPKPVLERVLPPQGVHSN
jgi:hypothetical protein